MSSSRHGETPAAYIEERASDDTVVRRYKRGKLLGKGGFARCYELTDLSNNRTLACKFIAKSSLVKQRAKDKLKTEIDIHSSLHHSNIVEFYRCWEDAKWVYILLELCPNHTLMEMVKARKRLTEPEVQLYLLQLIGACRYMQSSSVIHRDLKLGNLFLGPDMEIKVGDFGLATRLAHAGEKKRTICGTPNYIAPEILEGRKGHSYEVDSWSIGVIVYTMLIGKPPFETSDVKSTYRKIKANSYAFPSHVRISDDARSLIRALLSGNPEHRPTLSDMLAHPFMARAHRLPRSLPVAALRAAPLDFVDKAVANGATAHNSAVSGGASSAGLSGSPSASARLLSSAGSSSSLKAGGSSGYTSGRQPLGEIQASVAGSLSAGSKGKVPSSVGLPVQGRTGYGSSSANPTTSSTSSTASAAVAAAVAAASARARPSTAGDIAGGSASGNGRRTSGGSKTSSSSSNGSGATSARPGTAASSSSGNNKGGDRIEDDLDAEERGAFDKMHQKLAQSFAVDGGAGGGSGGAGGLMMGAAGLGSGSPSDADLTPPTWVTKWVDYSNKYGLGYQLSDGTTGVYFNDSTKIVVAADQEHVEYYDRKRTPSGSYDEQEAFILASHPEKLQKKCTLLKHFRSYLLEHTAPTASGDKVVPPEEAPKEGMVYVKKWMMTRHAIIFRLSNKTVQTNFFDHTKLVLSAEAKVVTYIDKSRKLTTFPLHSASTTPEISRRLKYAKDILYQLISKQRPATAAK